MGVGIVYVLWEMRSNTLISYMYFVGEIFLSNFIHILIVKCYFLSLDFNSTLVYIYNELRDI